MQKALFVTAVGKLVTIGTRPIPTPGPNEVLVKVTATMLLPHDTYGRDLGLFFAEKLPFILGSNIAGTVEKIGSSVTKYQIGQHIYGQGDLNSPLPNSTGLQEYALLRQDFSGLVPSNLTDDQLVTLPVNATTSFAALFHDDYFGFAAPFPSLKGSDKRDYSDVSIVIIGAGSNVGKLAVQYARIRGIGKIITIASLSGAEALKELGATHVIDRHSTAIVEEVHKITGPDSATHVYDCVSWTYELAASLVPQTKPSLIAVLHPAPGAVAELKRLGKENAVAKTVNGSRNNFEGSPVGDLFWNTLGTWVREGKIQIQKYKTVEGLDAQKVNEVLDSYRDGKPVLQGIVHPWGTVVV